MKLTYKYRIYPTAAQIIAIENQLSVCRHLYNWSILERVEKYEKDDEAVTYYDQ